MKKILYCFLFLSLVFALLEAPALVADHEILTKEQILLRMQEIADSYDLYEPLNEEDTKFIKTYSFLTESHTKPHDEVGISALKTRNFDVTKYNSNKTIGLWTKGKMWSDIGVINNSFGGKFNTYVIKGPNRAYQVQNTVRHTGYGLVGSGGIGKVYDGSVKTTCKKKGITLCSTDDKKHYTASVVYSYTWVTAKVWYDNGSTMSITID